MRSIKKMLRQGGVLSLVFAVALSGALITSPKAMAAVSWQGVGAEGFSAGKADGISLVFNGTTPYVAYTDLGNDSKATVMRFNGTAWEAVGTPGFSADSAYDVSLAFSGTTPYVAYMDNGNGSRATVMRFNGTAWEAVGALGFSAGWANAISLAFSGTTPYVAYRDYGNSERATVMRFNGTAWEAVGAPGFSEGTIYTSSLAFSGTTPYVAYVDGGDSFKATVMRFNGTAWEAVGGAPGFSASSAYWTSLKFDTNDTPHVAYMDDGNGSKATVMKFNGTTWEAVGSPGFSAGSVDYTSLAFDGSTPYVAYKDYSNSGKATVMKFNGTTWEAVGSPGFSADSAGFTSLAFDGTIPYVAYFDVGSEDKATVMRFVDNEATVTNVVDSKPVHIATPSGTNITCTDRSQESDLAALDPSYSYPLGFVDFCFDTTTSDNEVSVTFVTDLTPDEVVARKYNPSTEEYATISGAVITETTLSGQHALQVVYTITDNGPLDINPAVGLIDDPVGLALAEDSGSGIGVPNTGLPRENIMLPFATLLTGIVLLTSRSAAIRRFAYAILRK